ncbi:vWA domain-containing protein [Cohaesibacter gelatinilyticus]|uniref:Uncharacterized conserved protein YegL, contains vWA domain of TerY type n=1 Tax=Cohaesibacter gelatinilyticus TaxID=372072 RepID=A0A285PEB5_9HYPH|nr:VWA domain-containing protein [Cohaesibacter gelatinilyticus]SNZ20100.1 Uncharacterized conserved protein YegL, contains vWA domain of TerY type [Cohaesibacter gelatinilyticus]
MTINIFPNNGSQNQGTTKTLPLANQDATAPATVTAPASDQAEPALPVLNVIKRKSLPTGVASNVKQLVLLLLDSSSSMALLGKIDELNAAVADFIAELANQVNKGGFKVSIIEFDSSARLICSAESAETLVAPVLQASNGTNFDAPIDMAATEIEDFHNRPNPEGWHYLRPFVIKMSDGQANASEEKIQKLHELADVMTVAYGTDANKATLSRIASDGQVHVVGVDGSRLRSFLAQVGRTMTQTMAQNI